MNEQFLPYNIQKFGGKVNLCGDKSLSHRALIFASLAKGKSVIKNLLQSEDIARTMSALRKCNVNIYKSGHDEFTVIGGDLKQPKEVLYFGNSGTTSRLLIGFLSGFGFKVEISGDYSLVKRPMGRVVKPLEKLGASINSNNNKLPIKILNGVAKGSNENDEMHEFTFDVASAQVKSALLLAAQIANIKIKLTEPQKSRDHTENMLSHFGADITSVDVGVNNQNNEISLKKAASITPFNIDIAGDPSSAMFIIVASCLIEGDGVLIENVLCNEQRIEACNMLVKMGADISWNKEREHFNEKIADISVKSKSLLPIIDDGIKSASMIDEYPIMFIAAACCEGKSVFKNVGDLRTKECDRLATMEEGLLQLGFDCSSTEDSFTIMGQNVFADGFKIKSGQVIKSKHDHRIAMSFIILSMIIKQEIIVDDVSPIATSFPDFFNIIEALSS